MRYGVVGFETSGRALVEALLRLKFKPIVFDLKGKDAFDQEEIKNFKKKGVEFIFNYLTGDFKKVDLVILSSGIKHDFFKKNKIRFISEIDFTCSFLDNHKKDYIFITGTKGKGTTAIFTKFLLEELGLKVFLGGNIGESKYSRPAIYAIFESADVYVFEVSSFQLRSSFKAKPLIHTVVNLDIDHLDWHTSLKDYWHSKLKFLKKAKYGINQAGIENNFPNLTENNKLNQIEFGILKNVLDEFKINFFGEHNLHNLNLACKILEIYARENNLKIPSNLFSKAIRKFPKQKFVLQYEGEIKGIKIYNDSKSTNPLALKASLISFKKPVILICGGLTKGFSFSGIKDVLDSKVKYAVIFGKDKRKLAISFEKKKRFMVENLELGLNKALEVAKKGDVILFSPGCASLDMFQNAVERGQTFEKLVKKQ